MKPKTFKKMYVVKSTREGVEKPVVREVTDIELNIAHQLFRDGNRLPYDRFKLGGNTFPYYVDILSGQTSAIDEGYGSGSGDLWQWSYASFFYQYEAEEYYKNELKRVKEKYLS